MMSAEDATLTEALGLVRGTWAGVADNILHDKAVLWIGSGVSREKFPSVKALLLLLFERLQAVSTPAKADCPYRLVAQQIVGMTTVTGLDVAQPPVSWDALKREDLLNQLINQYADVLQISLSAVPGNSLALDFLRLHELYSDSSVKPDAEHRLIALLMAEGAVSEVVTTNWDPLVERGYGDLRCTSPLEVVACSAELSRAGHGPLLLKIHGCAERMKANPARYRPHMIATRHDINRWAPEFQGFREQVRTMLRAKPAVFIGISGQDFNLQAQCVEASIDGVTYPLDPPRFVFTVSAIGAAQRAILQGAYGSLYAPNAANIHQNAALPLYGKPLLGALFVKLVIEKLQCLLNLGDTQFPSDALRVIARDFVNQVELLLTQRYDAISNPIDRWRRLAIELPSFIARMLKLHRSQRMPDTQEAYEPIDLQHSASMQINPNLAAANLHWLLLALALLMEGRRLNSWSLELPRMANGEDGQLRAAVTVGDHVDIYFPNRADSAQQQLEANGVLVRGGGRRLLLIYPSGLEPARIRRSPARSLPGGVSRKAVSEIWLQDLANDAPNTPALIDMLRSAIISANQL
jgi:hypothetical protein